jgi:hypothetical protein
MSVQQIYGSISLFIPILEKLETNKHDSSGNKEVVAIVTTKTYIG